MRLNKCAKCGNDISESDKYCSNCGSRLPKVQEIKSDNRKPHKKSHLILAIIFIISLIVVFGVFFDKYEASRSSKPAVKSTNSKKDTDGYKPNLRLAYNVCIDLVKKQLKSPSSAKFPGLFESKDHVKYIGDKKYRITSWVESQNSFGATIRKQFTCIMIDKGNTYEMHDLSFQ